MPEQDELTELHPPPPPRTDDGRRFKHPQRTQTERRNGFQAWDEIESRFASDRVRIPLTEQYLLRYGVRLSKKAKQQLRRAWYNRQLPRNEWEELMMMALEGAASMPGEEERSVKLRDLIDKHLESHAQPAQ